MSVVTCVSSLENCLFSSFVQFLIGLFGFFWYWVVWAVYVFGILTPFGYIICKFISHSVDSFFILLMIFMVQNLLTLIRSHSFIFAFLSFALEDRFKKKKKKVYAERDFPTLSRSFMVLDLTLRYLNNFEFIFLCSVRKCSYLIVLYAPVHFSQNHLLKRLSYLHCISLSPLS